MHAWSKMLTSNYRIGGYCFCVIVLNLFTQAYTVYIGNAA